MTKANPGDLIPTSTIGTISGSERHNKILAKRGELFFFKMIFYPLCFTATKKRPAGS